MGSPMIIGGVYIETVFEETIWHSLANLSIPIPYESVIPFLVLTVMYLHKNFMEALFKQKLETIQMPMIREEINAL